ncbi:PorP/SprF family type IX secretion system membrane protein [Winogradskyella luteola]|uniref:PorP/SprF family type IX secretion system membrane protein n=1 Tax=Winogradskyella luteola TaxID=2828330 RepID=A0A9X1F7Z3_9FLAO|nr:PorP/SprF family type IX secretion system membrane protein [Winogradskyella luteola]MBV7268128.1 PorP/SprF family type IX secretion system membrane protein [Winogradskyella luteola]
MKTLLLIIIFLCFSIQLVWSQEDDGVVSFDLPIRNSLVFNRFAINPTFTFVREQQKYISFNNKREWVQFDNAPETFVGSFSGRFSENIGAGVAAFQQNYGVLTTFGGLLNFAYNVKLRQDNNLTFGLNVGAYKSGVNTSNVVTNFDDPSLQNVPENFLLTVNPGINYGTRFLDFGVSINNLVLYNFETSEMIQDDPRQSIQAHVMHTGFFNGQGFFEKTKFSGLLMSEFREDETIVSGLASLNVPRGIWLQIGYNSRFGVSGGLGLNITKNIALEYNVEKAIGEMVEFGPSHEITLAYRFITRKKYDYSGDEKVSGLFTKKRKKPIVKASDEELAGIRERAAERRAQAELDKEAALKAQKEAEANALAEAKEKAQQEAEAKVKQLAEERARKEAEAEAKLIAEQEAKEKAEAEAKEKAANRARLLAEKKAKDEAEAEAKRLAEQKAKQEAEAKAKALAEKLAKEEAVAKAQLLANQKAKEEAAVRAIQLAEQKAKEEAEAKALAEEQAREAAKEKAKLLAEQKVKDEAEAKAKELAEQKAREEAEARQLAEKQAQDAAAENARLLAEQKAKDDAKAKEELIENPKDELGKTMLELTKEADSTETKQKELLKEFDDIVEIKNKDLKDLKEENDLSEQGVKVQPRPFKSVTAENNKLNAIKADLDDIIEERSEKIDELKSLYEQRTRIKTTELDEVNLFYKKKIKRLTEEQVKSIKVKEDLEVKLEAIRVATEFEKRRRIKRAAYNNEDDRYAQDRAMLQNIKRTTRPADTPYTSEDFDFGEKQNDNIKILKNVKNAESGYYLIIAVHSDIKKRNDFVTKVVASGRVDVDFFYDVNTSKYYIYYNKFDSINAANKIMETKGDKPYNVNMTLVKIEN